MSIAIHNYDHSNADEWDEFCKKTHLGTFLHSRRFLSYHVERFKDRSIIVRKEGVITAIFPAAEKPADSEVVVSHPGITYGGLLHAGKVMGEDAIETLQYILNHYNQLGYKRLIYKAVPRIYHQVPCDDDLYAIFRLGGVRVRCDLSSTIDFTNRLSVGIRRKRSLIKAEKAGVMVESGGNLFEEFWEVLKDNLKNKHNAAPVHTLEEITNLVNLFPENINCTSALIEGRVVAGVVTFETPTCLHAQYIASSLKGYEVSALDAVFEFLISRAHKRGKKWFDFGISNENNGTYLNSGLYKFKSEFGGGGIIHEFYEIKI